MEQIEVERCFAYKQSVPAKDEKRGQKYYCLTPKNLAKVLRNLSRLEGWAKELKKLLEPYSADKND